MNEGIISSDGLDDLIARLWASGGAGRDGVRALPIATSTDSAAAIVALAVLVGSQTFLCFLREAYPINHFLEMAVFALLALNLTLSRGGWWIDVTAGLTFAVAALTLESGVLVWVVIAAAWLCGLRGVCGGGDTLACQRAWPATPIFASGIWTQVCRR